MRIFLAAVIFSIALSGCSQYKNQSALPSEGPPVDATGRNFEVQHAKPGQPSALDEKADQPSNPVLLSLQEQQMLNLINNERQKAGLAALVPNEELMRLARLKAEDMVRNNYFSHTSPTFGSPFDMMNQAGITYRMAAENIAGNYSLDGAHTSLMNSPGHRSNILGPAFNQVGIGIMPGGPYMNMFVQMFMQQ